MARQAFEPHSFQMLVENEAAPAHSITSVRGSRVRMLPDRHYCASAMLLSVLMLCLVQILARNLQASDVPVVPCTPANCSEPCPTLPPVCPSNYIRNCGCCDVCWIFLGEDDMCDTPVPENVVCTPGMWCNDKGRCEPIPLKEKASGK